MIEWIQRWRYRLEKGSPHLILLVALLLGIIIFSLVGGFIVFISGVGEALPQSMWWVFLRMSDPGYLGDDNTVVSAIFGTLFTVIGMVVFMAGLVSILTSLVTSSLRNLHAGRADVIFKNHIVIIGWNNEVFTLVNELVTAWEDTGVAILASEPKDTAEDELERRISSMRGVNANRKFLNRLKARVVYRNGNPLVPRDLSRVGVHNASHVIILAGELERGITTDVQQIRILHAINQVRSNCGAKADFTVIAELTMQQLRAHAFCALNINPREDAWVRLSEQQRINRGQESFLPREPLEESDQDITVVNGDQIVSRAVAQCAIQPFLSKVYDELLSFAGKELFLWKPNGEWQAVFDRAQELPPEQVPAFVNSHLSDGIIVGIRDAGSEYGSLYFKPAEWADKLAGNDLIVLSDKQSWRESAPQENAAFNFNKLIDQFNCSGGAPQNKIEQRNILILGVNRRLPILLEELSEYCEQYPGIDVRLTIVAHQISLEFDSLLEKYPMISKALEQNRVIQKDFTDWDVLGPIIKQVCPTSIILMTDDCALSLSDGSVDAKVTLALVMLRAYRRDPAWQEYFVDTGIVAEILDPQNRAVIEREQLANDIVVGNEYVSRFIAQVTSDFRLEELFRELLDYGDYELYLKPTADYGIQGSESFATALLAASQSGAIAIGYLYQQNGSMQLAMAPAASETMQQAECIVVIAES